MADVPALRRAILMLRHTARSFEPVSASGLSAALDIPRSTVYDILAVLEEYGMIRKVRGGYQLGAMHSELGSAYGLTHPLVRGAAPALRQLADALECHVHLAMPRSGGVATLSAEYGLKTQVFGTPTGEVQPFHRAAAGLAILARMPRTSLQALLSSDQISDISHELKGVRTRGYAVERGFFDPSTWTVAAALQPQSGNAIAAIGATLPTAGLTANREARAARAVRLTAEHLAERWGP